MVLHNRLWFYIMDYVKSIISEIIPGLWTLWTNYEHYEVPKPLMPTYRARPARQSLAPHRLVLRSAVGSSSEPHAGSQPGASGGGESSESLTCWSSLISARSLTCGSRVTGRLGRHSTPIPAHSIMQQQRVMPRVFMCTSLICTGHHFRASIEWRTKPQWRHAPRIAAGRWVELGCWAPILAGAVNAPLQLAVYGAPGSEWIGRTINDLSA